MPSLLWPTLPGIATCIYLLPLLKPSSLVVNPIRIYTGSSILGITMSCYSASSTISASPHAHTACMGIYETMSMDTIGYPFT